VKVAAFLDRLMEKSLGCQRELESDFCVMF
jgi:hypothetical protein